MLPTRSLHLPVNRTKWSAGKNFCMVLLSICVMHYREYFVASNRKSSDSPHPVGIGVFFHMSEKIEKVETDIKKRPSNPKSEPITPMPETIATVDNSGKP